jgi:hypothetical protein
MDKVLVLSSAAKTNHSEFQHIGFGAVDKIYLEFESAWWFDVDETFTGLSPLWEWNETRRGSDWLSSLSDEELLQEEEEVMAMLYFVLDQP